MTIEQLKKIKDVLKDTTYLDKAISSIQIFIYLKEELKNRDLVQTYIDLDAKKVTVESSLLDRRKVEFDTKVYTIPWEFVEAEIKDGFRNSYIEFLEDKIKKERREQEAQEIHNLAKEQACSFLDS
jgi:hypothetical protein